MNKNHKEIPIWEKSKKIKKFTVGEMFSGPGGIGLALNKTKHLTEYVNYSFEHSWASDYDENTAKTYQENIFKKNTKAIYFCQDVRTLDIQSLPNVDGFLYGFPCNDFSLVGKSQGEKGKFGGLYKYGIEFIQKSNPLFIFAENVSGIKSSNEGETFKKIISELNNAGKYGYDLSVHLYKFEEYGIPQRRHRYIIVGTRGDLNLSFKIPKPRNKQKSSKEALEIPPIKKDSFNHEIPVHSKTVTARLSKIKPGENAWNAKLPKELRLNVKGAKLSQIYKRLIADRPSYTITGSGGGGTHVYHWEEDRALTNREKARLQTFPDNFIFHGGKESVRNQVGMAVPVKGAEIILKALLKTFSNNEYESIEPSFGYFKNKTL
jgi:DNA (cytosine-5)-methyltransferase 1